MMNLENSLKKPKLWVISELFPPEETSTAYIMGEVAHALLDKYDVSVICGPDVYDENKKGNPSANNDVFSEVVRVARVKEDKKSTVSRAKKFLLMSWRLYKEAKRRIKDGDTVFMVSNPFPLILLISRLRKKKKVRLTMLVHDIFPEGLYTDMNLPGFAYSILGKLFNRAYSKADTLISLGRDMSEILESKCYGQKHQPEIVIIENWGDLMGIKPIERESDGFIKIQYAGNIGNAQGVGEMVEWLQASNNPHVQFSIWGTGSAEESIKIRVKELNLINQVQFNGPYSRSQQNEVLNDSDLSLVSLVKGMYGLGVPSKTYNILAAGKPILYIGERGTEIWRTIEENDIGYCFEPDDNVGVVNFIKTLTPELKPRLQLMGNKAREVAEKKYSKESILDKFVSVV